MPRLALTVLGNSSGGVPGGSGYLLESDAGKLLVDCGNGVLASLARHAKLADLAGVYVSHLHADHVGDLIALALWSRFTKRKTPVWGPVGLRTLCYRWFALFHSDPDAYVEALALRELKPWETFEAAGMLLTAAPVEHNVPCLGLRAKVTGGPSLFYTADTKASALVVEAAEGVDLLLAEATYQDPVEGRPLEASRAHHMTAREAARAARDAGAKRLVLTHLLAHLDPAVSLAQAKEEFSGDVRVASVGARYEN